MPPSTQAPRARFTLRRLMLFIAVAAVPLAIAHRVVQTKQLQLHRALVARDIARNRAKQAMQGFVLKKGATRQNGPTGSSPGGPGAPSKSLTAPALGIPRLDPVRE
jgi:hypothetical protein